MKIKFSKENIKEFSAYLAMGSVVVGMIGGGSLYYLYDNFSDNVKQSSDTDVNTDDLEITENGEMYYVFNEGEHKVKISHNDMFYRKIEAVEGYEIIDVQVNGWRDNSQVTFVNKVPVKVKMTGNEEGRLKFDSFGEVIEKENIKSK